MKKLLYILLLFPVLLHGQSSNTTNTKFTNGLQVPNGATPKPTSGLTAGALSYVTGVGLQYYDGSAWQTLGTSSGAVPTTRTITINGTTFDLSANRTWSVGTVTSLTPGYGFTSLTPITSSGTLTIDTATANTGLVSKSRLASFTYTKAQADARFAPISVAGSVTSVAALTLGTTGTDLSSSVANSTTTPVITLNVPTASASNRGALSAADWTTFNSKQAAGNYITALTGDVTATGPGSAAATLATVATAGTTGGSTAIPVITINAKGLTTGITTAAVIAPAGTLTGTTLASNVVTSSLTSVGTITTGVWNAGAVTSSGAGVFASTAKGTKGIWTAVTSGTAGTDSLLVKKSSDNATYKISPTYYQVAGSALAGTLTFGTHLSASGTSYNGSSNVTIASDATSSNTLSTIVARDGSGNFSAGTITSSAFNSSGIFTSTASAGDIVTAINGAASSMRISLANTGGYFIAGVNNSAGNAIMTTAAYASYIFTHNSTDLVLGTNDVPRLTLGSAGTITAGTTLAMGSNNITSTGSLGSTGSRLTKLWATDIESTNMPTVGGTSLSSTFAPIAGTMYIGTTAHALNRASASEALTGITSIDGSAAKLTTARTIGGVSFDGTANTTVATATGGFAVSGGQGRATSWYVGTAAETPPVWNALYSDHVIQNRYLGIVSFRDSVGIIWNNIYSDTPAGNNVLLSNGHGYRIQMTGGNYQFQVSTPGNAGDSKSLTTKVSWDEQGNGTFVGKVTLADEAYSSSWNGKLEAPTKNAIWDAINSGTFTPTIANISNSSGLSTYGNVYTRIGNIVTVYGNADVTTGAAGSVVFSITLPVASNFVDIYDLTGVGQGYNSTATPTNVLAIAETTSDVAQIFFNCTSANATSIKYTFSYQVK